MRVLLINTSERIGGAAVACSRLMEALKNHGVQVKMLVRDKQTNRLSVVATEQKRRMKWNFLWERLCIWMALRLKRRNLFEVDIANAGCHVTSLPEFEQADIIHLHWVNQGMLSLKELKKILASGKPVVWTMHDMWPCTAICHHARTCRHFAEKECHNCPYLNDGDRYKDLSYRVFHRKRQTYRTGKIDFVACSRWLEALARQSKLTEGQRVCSIPNPINTSLFRPTGKTEARLRAGLPIGRKLLLFGSVKVTDKRKGLDYMVESCRLLAEKYPELKEKLTVVVLGNGAEALEPLLPFSVHAAGYVADEHKLADIYNGADLYVTPSLQENLPNTIMEAMACGTPCVGFDIGGIPEMIDHLHNGYVAEYRSAADLAEGIYWVLTSPEADSLGEAAARKAATHYSESAVARQYIKLYNEL